MRSLAPCGQLNRLDEISARTSNNVQIHRPSQEQLDRLAEMADEVVEENPRKKIRLDESAALAQRTENSVETDTEKEMRLGITAFTNRAIGGFSGILKQRYTDFLVNEILLSGQVLHLENIAGSEKDVDGNSKIASPSAKIEPVVTTPSAGEKIAAPSLAMPV